MTPSKTSVLAVIRNKLEQALTPQKLEIRDISALHAGHAGARPGGETHFELEVTSERFRGLNRVQRHQLIYGILKEEMAGPIHALAITAEAP